MTRELLVRAADHGPTYLTWRWLDDREKVEYAVLDNTALFDALAHLEMALPHPLFDETGVEPIHRALVNEGFSDPEQEAALATRLAAGILPDQLARQLTNLDGGSRIRLRVTPSPRLARVPWELLALPDGRRLVEVADVAHDPPAIVHAHRDLLPTRWELVADSPVVYVINPRPGSSGSVLDMIAELSLETWLSQLKSARRIDEDDHRYALCKPAGRCWLGSRLRDRPSSRLVYFGHASAADDEPGSAAIHFADQADVYGLARPNGDHRPFVALDLVLGTITANDDHPGPRPIDRRAPGYQIWPMPPRVAMIACESGGDSRHPEPFGLIFACLNAGAEIVTATRWTLPTNTAFHKHVDVDIATGPTTDMLRAVDRCHDLADPVAGIAAWQRERLAAWTSKGHIVDTPLLWASLSTHVAPGRR